MSLLWQICGFIFALALLITLHEFAHFYVAKLVGVKVLRFAIGFGRPLWRYLGSDGTEYVIAPFLLGGYVKLVDTREGQVPLAQRPFAFDQQSIMKRFAIVAAGPIMNLLLAVLIFMAIFMLGFNQVKPIIGKVAADSIAAEANIMPGSEIIRINGQKCDNWQCVVMECIKSLGDSQMVLTTREQQGDIIRNHNLLLDYWRLNNLNPDPLQGLGITPYQPKIAPVIAKILKGGAADKAGLKPGDRIISIDQHLVSDWLEVTKYIQSNPLKAIALTIERVNHSQNIIVYPQVKRLGLWQKIGFLGIEPAFTPWPEGMQYSVKYPWLKAGQMALQKTMQYTVFNGVVLYKMVTGKLSLGGLGGPITIFTATNNALREGIVAYASFLAILSVTLGFVNFLPIPGLDGGHIFLLLLEALYRRPLSVNLQAMLIRIGMAFLLILIVIATTNDILRLFW